MTGKPSLLTTPIGDDRLSLALKREALERAQAAVLLELSREGPDRVELRASKQLSQLGNEAQLRGLPAIGRGCRGAMRGSVPHIDGIERADRR